MITNLPNWVPDEAPRMGGDEYGQYGSCSDDVSYEDGLDRHPSRLKRVRLNEDDHPRAERDVGHEGRNAGWDRSWSLLQANQDKPIARFSAVNEQEEPEEEAEGESPSNSFHSSSSSTLTHSQHSSPLQPTTPDHSQPFPSSWSTEPSGWSKPMVTDEMELLAVIEKQAETYSSGPGSDALLTHAQQAASIWPTRHHRPPDSNILSLSSHPAGHLTSATPPAVQDKPFKCSLCPKSFTRNYDLTRHKSSHIDQRQHRCSKCGRSFNRRDALIRHTLVKSCGHHP